MASNQVLCFIDDDKIYQYTVSRTIKMQALAHQVLLFNDGEEAMDYLTGHSDLSGQLPDVIFLDINMPIMNGWQFLDEYASLKPRLPKPITIYMVTSSVDPEDRIHASRIAEISDYIVKPVKPEILKSLIDKIQKI